MCSLFGAHVLRNRGAMAANRTIRRRRLRRRLNAAAVRCAGRSANRSAAAPRATPSHRRASPRHASRAFTPGAARDC
jgi:hypothetical protein